MRRLRIEDSALVATPDQVAISQGAGQIVYVLRSHGSRGRSADVHAAWSVSISRKARPSTTHRRAPTTPRPRGHRTDTQIAFLRKHSGVAQIAVLTLEGGEVEELHRRCALGAGAPHGARTAPGSRSPRPSSAERATTRRRSSPIGSTTRPTARLSAARSASTLRRRTGLEGVPPGHQRRLACRRPAWSPDGTSIAFAAPTAPDADLRAPRPVFVVDARPRTDGPARRARRRGRRRGHLGAPTGRR